MIVLHLTAGDYYFAAVALSAIVSTRYDRRNVALHEGTTHREAAARAASSQRQCNALSVASTQTVPTPRSHSNKDVDQRQSGSVKLRKSDLIAACDAVAQDVCEPIETCSSRPPRMTPIIFLFHFSQKLKLNNDSIFASVF